MLDNLNFNKEFIVNSVPINEISKKIFLIREHALIGVSPFNSYYTEDRINKLIAWAEQNFKKVNVFVPDRISQFTLEAIGYDEKRALQKTKRQDSYLKNKVIKSFMRQNLTIEESIGRIISLSNLSHNKNYTSVYNLCLQEYQNNNFFKDCCLEASREIISSVVLEEKKDNVLDKAVKYFLSELPIFLNTPDILEVDSSCFIYHNPPDAVRKLLESSSIANDKQGFLIIEAK